MTEKDVSAEVRGCIVCGKLYQLYVVQDAQGGIIDGKVLNTEGRVVSHLDRMMVACKRHTDEDVEAAAERVYGDQNEDEEDE
ncbi:MAG: hypothetical protein C4557_00985 [Anaerolineaceae bacterium]|jgi:hypothetical protein|nr:MAG: hypothetical protein C4557_00985 [Anaerolineaceae bacterium]